MSTSSLADNLACEFKPTMYFLTVFRAVLQLQMDGTIKYYHQRLVTHEEGSCQACDKST